MLSNAINSQFDITLTDITFHLYDHSQTTNGSLHYNS